MIKAYVAAAIKATASFHLLITRPRMILGLCLCALIMPAGAELVEEHVGDTPERIVHHRQDWGEPGFNVCAHESGKKPLTLQIGGRTFSKGIGSHASSEIAISLDSSCRRFEATAGIQDGQRRGSAEFMVRLDGRVVFRTGIIRHGEAARPVRVELNGARLLELSVNDGGDGITEDLANWADALLVRDNSVPTEALPTADDLDIAPFATVIGSSPIRMDGVHNGRFDTFPRYELNPDWPVAADDEGCMTTDPEGGNVSIGLRWLERRRVRHLELKFQKGGLPPADKVRVQRWVMEKSGGSPGGSKWQGHWVDAQGKLNATEDHLRFVLDWKGDYKARNEGTLKVRWVFPAEKAVRVRGLSAWTDTQWTTNTVTFQAINPLASTAEISVYNGAILSGDKQLSKSKWDGAAPLSVLVRHSQQKPWKTELTVIRVGVQGKGFGVSLNELIASRTIRIPAYGIEVSLGNERTETTPAMGILEQVREKPDQTFQGALAALERPDARLGPTLLSLACDNFKVVLQRQGQIGFETSTALYNHIDRELPQKYTCLFEPRFGPVKDSETTRQLEDGWLPIPTITKQHQGIVLKQKVFVAPVGGSDTTSSRYFDGSRAVAVSDFLVENTTDSVLPVEIGLHCFREVIPGPGYIAGVGLTTAPARREGNSWVYEKDGDLMCAVVPANDSPLQTSDREGTLSVTGLLPAGAQARFTVLVPGWRISASELAALPATADLLKATRSHWERVMSEAIQFRLPDPMAETLIRASQVHCMIASRNRDQQMVAPWIGSVTYGPLESESQAIIHGMEAFGHFEFARRAHDYFISRYNDEGFIKPTYTIVGTGWHLWALGEYVRLSGDVSWMRANSGEVIRVCRWIQAQLAKTHPEPWYTPDPSLKGLMPPGALADWESFASWYSLNGWFYAGLHSAASALLLAGQQEGNGFLATADSLRDAIRISLHKTQSMAPVVPLRNGTWIPFYPSHPECPMPVEVMHANEDAGRSWCYDVELGSHHLIPQGVLDHNGPEADAIVAHLEDIQYLRAGWNCYPAERSQQDWFNFGGFAKVQPFYARSAEIHAMRDDIKPFLRTWINSAASLVNTEDLSLWEHFFNGAWNKTHETGWFLTQASLIFAMERGDELWLAPFVSDQWLKDGMTVEAKGIPTSFGRAGFTISSHIKQNRIDAVIESPVRKKPKAIFLRVRHPEGKSVSSVEIDGITASGWNQSTQTIRCTTSSSAQRVTLHFGP